MIIDRRRSDRCASDFPIGTPVLAKPATVSRPIRGTVVATSGAHTVIIDASGLEIAVDVEDLHLPKYT